MRDIDLSGGLRSDLWISDTMPMWPLSRFSLPLLLSGLLLGLGLTGCVSSRTAEQVARNRAAVLGTWEYRTDNISALHHGTFQVTVQDGRLKGQFRDSWRGTLDAQINVHGSRMELMLDRVRITGRLEQNRFKAAVRRDLWDVSMSGNRRSTGYFVARRVRRESTMDEINEFGCASLLREVSYSCSPFDAAGH